MSKPVQTFRAGAVQVAIFTSEFQKDGKTQTMFNATVTRSYKKGDTWEHTSSFGRDDIPKVIYVLNKAYDYVMSTGNADLSVKASNSNDNPF